MSGFILAAVSLPSVIHKSLFVLLGRWSKGTLFNYLLYFFFLLTTVVPMAAPPLMNNRAIHNKRLELSPVCGDLSALGLTVPPGSFAVTVAALVISFIAAASEKYFLQPSQYQYAMLPSSATVAAFASMCFRSVWLFGSGLP